MKKTVVINVVGLTHSLLKHMPNLSTWAKQGASTSIIPPLPAVTCSSQATFLTGKWPAEHGIVGNGWYFDTECEVKFWRQSNKLIQAKKIWEYAKDIDSSFTCANMFWWYNMYSTCDYSVTPRPNYLADGRKIPDIYSYPADMRDYLQKELGSFPLFDFWGPKTSIKSSEWISDASKLVAKRHEPTLTLIYLPHLDYNLQRHGLNLKIIQKDLDEIDAVCKDLIDFYEQRDAQVIILSEYGITNVDNPISINRIFREKGLINIREERGLELLDVGASKAFAVADHQIAHIYVNDKSKLNEVQSILENINGVELILDGAGKEKYNLNHNRAGDFVVVADKNAWFTYYYWHDNQKAPDFARTVAIHDKPGYDPVEMFTDPEIFFLLPKIGIKLLKKKLGFRMLMDVIPLKPELVKGSHGRIPENITEMPLILSKRSELIPNHNIQANSIKNLLMAHIF